MSTLAFIGDLMLGRGVSNELRRVAPESVWGSTLPVLRAADAVIANLECAITSQLTPTTLTPAAPHFRADAIAADVLCSGNVHCVSLANDHSLDFGEDGLFDTLDALDRAGITHMGAGRTLGRAASPALVRVPDLTVAVVGLTDQEPSFAATAHAAGTHYVDIEKGPTPGIGLEQLASHCRERKAGMTVLSLHWGASRNKPSTAKIRDFAHAAIDAGFDLIHGHASHQFEGVEIYRDRPIFYDTGDFIDDYRANECVRNQWSFIFLVDGTQHGIEHVRLVPVRLSYARVDLANGSESRAICRLMLEKCAALGTRAAEVNGTLTVECTGTRASKALHAALALT